MDTINGGNYAVLASATGDELRCANSIWTASGVKPTNAFSDVAERFYSAELTDGGDFGPDTVNRVNRWASDHTDGMVPTIVQTFPKPTYLVVLTALAFDADWLHRFDADRTHPGVFTLASGEKVSVPMMNISHEFGFTEKDGATILKMLYKGGKFQFVAILPPAGVDATQYLRQLTPARFDALANDHESRHVDVTLPKFEMRTGGLMNDEMKGLGLGPLYESCDLSRLSPQIGRSSTLTQVIQRCYIKVDEEGTRAAAVTEAATAGATSSPVKFAADRPFVFAIVSTATNAILFLGIVDDPRG